MLVEAVQEDLEEVAVILAIQEVQEPLAKET